jgi:hypothetical protein
MIAPMPMPITGRPRRRKSRVKAQLRRKARQQVTADDAERASPEHYQPVMAFRV